jgi:hypothetical protein
MADFNLTSVSPLTPYRKQKLTQNVANSIRERSRMRAQRAAATVSQASKTSPELSIRQRQAVREAMGDENARARITDQAVLEELERRSKMRRDAAFLEENAVDVVDPEPAVLIEISRDLEGTQGVTFKSSTRLENGDRSFVYETETRAKGDIRVPREFTLEIPLYEGEEPTSLRCAFRWRISGGALQMGFQWRRVEYQRRAHFAQIANAAAEATGRPVFFGRVA